MDLKINTISTFYNLIFITYILRYIHVYNIYVFYFNLSYGA